MSFLKCRFKILTLWYRLTALVPRRLPRTPDEWTRLQEVLRDHFGVPPNAFSWYTVAGHVASTQPHRLRRSYSYLANVALRLDINKLANSVRQAAHLELSKALAEAQKRAAQEASPNPEGTPPGGSHGEDVPDGTAH